MQVFKPNVKNSLNLLIIELISVITLSIIGFVVGNIIVAIILFVLLTTAAILHYVFTNKKISKQRLYIGPEGINIKLNFEEMLTGCNWTQINKVDYLKNHMILTTMDKEIKISKSWENDKVLWLLIYSKIKNKNKRCTFSDSILKQIESYKSQSVREIV